MLFCSHSTPTNAELDTLAAYARRMQTHHDAKHAEIIIASENGTTENVPSWQGANIQFETEESLLEDLVDWNDYRNDISRRYALSNLPDSELATADVFVPPRVSAAYDHQIRTDDLQDCLDTWLSDSSRQQYALLGDYGQGKSTAMLAYTHRLLNSSQSTRIPILIELRGTSPRNLTPLELLGAWSVNYNINANALYHLHLSGKLLLIFEGFDEMALVGDSEMRLKHFRMLWQFCYPNAKIVITGRPNFFFDEQELISSLGISEPHLEKPYCNALRLNPFNIDQISEALRGHDRVTRDEICAMAKTNAQFRELISRPSLLHIVAVLWQKEELSKQLTQITSAYVMKLFIRHSFRRQGLKESDSREFSALTTNERAYFMRGIATFMASNELPNQISSTQLHDIVESLFHAMPENVSLESDAIKGEVRQRLSDRMRDAEHGMDHIQSDVRTCGILVDDPAAPGTFRFGHKSFMEYLFAEVIADRILDDQDPESASLMNACRASASRLGQLPVSIEFLSEILSFASTRDFLINSQRNLVKKVFRLLFDDLPSYVLARNALVVHTLASLPRLPKRFKIILRMRHRKNWAASVLVFSTAVSSTLFAGTFAPDQSNRYTYLFTLPILTIMLAAMFSQAAMNNRAVNKNLILWRNICRELCTSDKILADFSGFGWLTGVRSEQFQLHIDSIEKEE